MDGSLEGGSMTGGTFQRVEKTDERMYGTRGILVCGYPAEEHGPLTEFMSRFGGGDLCVVFVSDVDTDRSLMELLAMPHEFGKGLPRQLWATLTPASESWTVRELLKELAREAEAMGRKGL